MSSSPLPPASKQQRQSRTTPLPKSQHGKLPPLRRPIASPLPPPTSPPILKSSRKGRWILFGGIYCLSCYTFFLYRSYTRAVASSSTHTVPLDVSDRYNKTAATYDGDVNMMEKAMWLGRMRKKLISQASGHVLEVSVGTGRNMQYYRPKTQSIKTLTFVDQSPQMIEIAKSTFKSWHPTFRAVVFRTQSAASPILVPDANGFDTIIQTMGLCSTPDPEGVLRNLGRVLRKDGGKILLLEHGRSHYEWVNGLLDALAPAHAERHGCWWNRDIGGIVESVGAEGALRIISVRRYHLGTTWVVEMRRDDSSEDGKEEKAKQG